MQLSVSSVRKGLDVAEIQLLLRTHLVGIGDKLIYLPTVDSTNTVAMKLANERSEEGVVVLTDSQTAGKGRLGRRWVDTFGCNVLSSTLLQPLFPPHFLIMVASLAIVDTIAKLCGITAVIKWPNDVLIGNRKVAGILIETSHILHSTVQQENISRLVAILGIGINVNGTIQDILVAPSLEASHSSVRHPSGDLASVSMMATTLEMECGHVVSREACITHLLQSIETDYLQLQQEAREPFFAADGCGSGGSASHTLLERWRSHLSTLGRSIYVHQGNTVLSGIAEEVNENGELLLRLHSGELVTVNWGDVGYPTE